MKTPEFPNPHSALRTPHSAFRGFTLIEIVIALTIVAIMVAVAVPTMKGLREEKKARAPVDALANMVREIRGRAMTEGRAYQIVFSRRGFQGTRFLDPYLPLENLDTYLEEVENKLARERGFAVSTIERRSYMRDETAPPAMDGMPVAGAVSDPVAANAPSAKQFQLRYELPEKLAYRLLFWGELDWVEMNLAEVRRWVFQPSGMCKPLKVRFEHEEIWFEVDFSALTGEIQRERFHVP